MQKGGCVYILASKNNAVVYIGVTSDLYGRVWKHRNGFYPDAFTKKYHCHKLVFFEFHSSIVDAINREKRMKKWKREWKNMLIEQDNPDWLDLFGDNL